MNKTNVRLSAGVMIGLIVGVYLDEIPGLKFENNVNIGEVISFLSLISAVFIIPFLIEKYLNNQSNIKAVMLADVEDCLIKIEVVAEHYQKLFFSGIPLTIDDRKLLINQIRRITVRLESLTKNFNDELGDKKFKTEVYDHFNEETYKKITENLCVGEVIAEPDYLGGYNALEKTTMNLKSFRYIAYK